MSLPSYNDGRSTPAPPGCPVWQAGGYMHRMHWVCALLIGAGWGCVLPQHLEQHLWDLERRLQKLHGSNRWAPKVFTAA
jgi:hypothetical protein